MSPINGVGLRQFPPRDFPIGFLRCRVWLETTTIGKQPGVHVIEMTCREFATRSTCLLLRYAAVLKKRDHAAYLSYPVDGLGIPEKKATNFKPNGSDVKTDLKAYCCLAVFYLACTPFVFALGSCGFSWWHRGCLGTPPWLWTATMTSTSAILEPGAAVLDVSCALQTPSRINRSPQTKVVNWQRWSAKTEQTTTTKTVVDSESWTYEPTHSR